MAEGTRSLTRRLSSARQTPGCPPPAGRGRTRKVSQGTQVTPPAPHRRRPKRAPSHPLRSRRAEEPGTQAGSLSPERARLRSGCEQEQGERGGASGVRPGREAGARTQRAGQRASLAPRSYSARAEEEGRGVRRGAGSPPAGGARQPEEEEEEERRRKGKRLVPAARRGACCFLLGMMLLRRLPLPPPPPPLPG